MDPEPHTILLVDDDSNDVFLFERAARDCAPGVALATAVNGHAAVEFFAAKGDERTLPRLIVTDLKMPVMDGFAFLDWLGRHPVYQSIPVLVWSSSAEGGDVERAYQAGARAYLIKPAKFEELRRMVHAAISFWRMCE
jgi:CheY-like chemotaxis protein